jgi:hypothetical protein
LTRKYIYFYKILGLILIICSIIGYLTVADDIRHTGEFIGVSGVLISGIIFIFFDIKLSIFKRLSLQWIAICISLSIPLGGVLLDNMFGYKYWSSNRYLVSIYLWEKW